MPESWLPPVRACSGCSSVPRGKGKETATSAEQEWRERLGHAHRYWEENGLTPGGGKGFGRSDAFRYIEFYRGNQWDGLGWGDFSEEDCVTVNVTFANTNALVSRLSKRSPQVVVTPTRTGSEESARARRNELVMKYFVRELKMKRQIDLALVDALLTPFGFVQHGFTAPQEKDNAKGQEIDPYSMARAGWPWVKRRPFWDIRVDPLADSFHPDGSATWVAFRDLVTERQIDGNPRLIKRDDLRPTKSADLMDGIRRRKRADTLPEWYDLFELWWVYEKVNRQWFCVSPGSTKFLMEPQDWPIPWETLPYDYLAFNEQVDSNIPVPYPQSYEQQQIELNKTRTLMANLVKSQRRLVIASREAFSDEDQKKLEAGNLGLRELFLATGDLSNAVIDVALGGFGQELLAYDAKIKEDIREQIGLSQMDRAQRVNVETASEANAIQAGSSIQAGRNEDKFEQFWTDVLSKFHQTLRYTLTADILIPIAGEKDATALSEDGSFITVNPQDIAGEFSLAIRAGSTLPENHELRFAKALQMKQATQGDSTVDQREMTATMFEEAGFDSSRLMLNPQDQAATEAALASKGLGGGPDGAVEPKGLDANMLRQLAPGGGPFQ